jgi:hypothetical protein
MPLIFLAVSDRNPHRPVSRHWIRFLNGDKFGGRLLAILAVVPLVNPATLNHAAGSIPFPGGPTFPCQHPLSPRRYLIAYQMVDEITSLNASIIALEDGDDLFHLSSIPRTGAESMTGRSSPCLRISRSSLRHQFGANTLAGHTGAQGCERHLWPGERRLNHPDLALRGDARRDRKGTAILMHAHQTETG